VRAQNKVLFSEVSGMRPKTWAVLGLSLILVTTLVGVAPAVKSVYAEDEANGCNNAGPNADEGCGSQSENTPDEQDEMDGQNGQGE
jgi:hypothetical protein